MEADVKVMSGLGGIQPENVVEAKIQRNLDHFKVDDETLIEIGYAFMPSYWR
jgi:hypothetical protein